MFVYHSYALVIGIVLAVTTCAGVLGRSKRLILLSMIFAAIIASPVTSFTRGTAGAVYPSDFVAGALLLCLIFGGAPSMFSRVAPTWYRFFLALMALGALSVVFVAPLTTSDLTEMKVGQNVSSPLPGLPLPVLMAGFRLGRIVLFVMYFMYAAKLAMDAKVARFTSNMIVLAITGLAACQILTFFGVVDLGLYMPQEGYEYMHIVGHPKSAAGRLYVIGIFLCVMLLYRVVSSPVYIGALATIVVGLFVSGSRAALVGAVAGIMVFAALAKVGGKVFAVLLILLAIVALPYVASLDIQRTEQFVEILDPSTNARWIIWDWTLKYLFGHPYIFVTGVGFSNYYYALYSDWTVAEHGHNDVLTCLIELGMTGVFLFVCYIVYLGRDILRKLRSSEGRMRWEALCLGAILGGFVATGLFEASLYYSAGAMPMQRIVAILFGIYSGWWAQQRLVDDLPITQGESQNTPELGVQQHTGKQGTSFSV